MFCKWHKGNSSRCIKRWHILTQQWKKKSHVSQFLLHVSSKSNAWKHFAHLTCCCLEPHVHSNQATELKITPQYCTAVYDFVETSTNLTNHFFVIGNSWINTYLKCNQYKQLHEDTDAPVVMVANIIHLSVCYYIWRKQFYLEFEFSIRQCLTEYLDSFLPSYTYTYFFQRDYRRLKKNCHGLQSDSHGFLCFPLNAQWTLTHSPNNPCCYQPLLSTPVHHTR